MSDFRDKAKDRVGGAVDGAADIARDQLDTFKKLGANTQKIILGVAGVFVVLILAWLLWPKSLNVIVTCIVEDNILEGSLMSNSVIVLNKEKIDLGPTTIIMNGKYEYTLEGLPPDETISISVTEFYPKGKPDGAPPANDYVPRGVAVRSEKGSLTVWLDRK